MITQTVPHFRVASGLLAMALWVGCGMGSRESRVLTAEVPLHLEEHFSEAHLEGSTAPDTTDELVEWRFNEPQPGWRPIAAPRAAPVVAVRSDDALRLSLSADNPSPMNSDLMEGYIYVDLPAWRLEDWGHLEITARASGGMRRMGALFNYTEDDRRYPDDLPFYSGGDRVPLVSDGTVQTYRLSLTSSRMRPWDGPWTHLGLWFNAPIEEDSPTLELLSIRVIPAAAEFAEQQAGVRLVARDPAPDSETAPRHRRSLFMHSPGALSYDVEVPAGGRLDVGLGVLSDRTPVDFSISVQPRKGEAQALLEETWSDSGNWAQRSVDLTPFAGETVSLVLATDSEEPGNVAFWAAPTLSGSRATDRPNIVFYVIDGGGADYMSAYGYDRETTPNLERIAAEGALFERVHSNSGWTRPSTVSFLTSLQHSTLGGLREGRNTVPTQVLTMAERLHQAGYQTALFTTNTNAGSISGLDRGNDMFREAGVENWSTSSVDLQDNYWGWRLAYPGEPYWVHFQTTDVHNPHAPEAPFSGLFIDPERRAKADEWTERAEEIPETDEVGIIEALDQIGADQGLYWTSQHDLHDECMVHQDAQLGQLVDRLKDAGEWENTLLIVTGDHSVAAGSWDYQLLTQDPQPPHIYHDDLGTPMLRSGVSRVPLIVVWPGRIAPGQRFRQRVSLLDVLPTILELADLSAPELLQGQSLAPLLLAEGAWQQRPVFLDEFEVVSDKGEFRGRIEVIDERWGASLLINPDPDAPETRRRAAPLLLYDLLEDPFCLDSVHEEHPDLVRRYTRLLQGQFKAHRDLGKLLEPGEDSPLTGEQLETLRSLGYIQ